MRNKRLVAAMTALSLAVTPAQAWAVDVTADPADATKAGATTEVLSTEATEDPKTTVVPDAETTEEGGIAENEPAGEDLASGDAASEAGTTRDDESASDAEIGDVATSAGDESSRAKSLSSAEDPADLGAEAQERASNLLSGDVLASSLDGSTDYVLADSTTIHLDGGTLSLQSLTTTYEGVNHTLVVSGPGTLVIPNHIAVNGLSVTNGARASVATFDAVGVVVAGGGSSLSSASANISDICSVTGGATFETSSYVGGYIYAQSGASVVAGNTNVFRIEVGDGAMVSLGATATQYVDVTGGGSLSVGGSLTGTRLNVANANVTVDGSIAMTSDIVVDDGTVTSGGPASADGRIEVLGAAGRLEADGRGGVAVTAGSIAGTVVTPENGSIADGGLGQVVVGPDGGTVTDTVVLQQVTEDVDPEPDSPYTLYYITGPEWVQGSAEGMLFGTNAARDEVVSAYLDDVELTDGWGVFANGDGAVIGVVGRVLERLEPGEHTLTVAFADATTASISFVVRAGETDIDHVISGGGVWEHGSDLTLPFGTNAIEDPSSVAVTTADGVSARAILVPGVDYTVSGEAGALDIELLPAYLDTLALGDYELSVTFADGDSGTALFSVVDDVGRDYLITAGIGSSWEQETDAHLPFETNGHADDLTGVMINGRMLVEGTDYTVFDSDGDASGDNVGIMLNDEYLDTLDVDQHDIVVAFADGDADGHFFVTAADSGTGVVDPPTTAASGLVTSTGGGTLPKTGDPAIAVGGIVGAGALLGAIGAALRRRKDLGDQEA